MKIVVFSPLLSEPRIASTFGSAGSSDRRHFMACTTESTDREAATETVRDERGDIVRMSELDLLIDELAENEERCCRIGDIVAQLIRDEIERRGGAVQAD
jgi:hypothetical protein